MRSTSRSTLRRVMNRTADPRRTPWPEHAALRHSIARGPEAPTLKAFEALDAEGVENAGDRSQRTYEGVLSGRESGGGADRDKHERRARRVDQHNGAVRERKEYPDEPHRPSGPADVRVLHARRARRVSSAGQ